MKALLLLVASIVGGAHSTCLNLGNTPALDAGEERKNVALGTVPLRRDSDFVPFVTISHATTSIGCIGI